MQHCNLKQKKQLRAEYITRQSWISDFARTVQSQAAPLAPRHFQNTIWTCLSYWLLTDPFCRLLRDVIGDWMISVTATAAAKIANAFEWPDNPRRLPLPLGESAPPSLREPTRVFIQNGMSIGSAVFVWVQIAMLYNALSLGKKTSKIAPSFGIASPRRKRTESRRWATRTKMVTISLVREYIQYKTYS